ncbi:MAG: hypothetical protein EA356_06540 [Geminicoccaceae bacterium]|nr:MAG: hypothetical protein EA356_06540 [Geminicoccaceae bacterium]
MRVTTALRTAPRWPLALATGGLIIALVWALWPGPTMPWVQGWTAWVVETQRHLHGQLAAALQAVREGGLAAGWPLIALSFGYGVFHAAGPGHGKVVISTYIATHESRLPQALALTAASALAQALTAIVAVHVAVTLLGYSLRQARGTVGDLESLSFALVAGLGALLMLRAGRGIWRRGTTAPCSSCGHHHPPSPPKGRLAALGVVLAVGIRPCAGAVVVLLLAYAGDLRLIGIAAVLAMAVGTAITTGALASLAVLARNAAIRLAAWLPGGGGRLGLALDVAALMGGLVIFAVGALLFQASLQAPAPHPFR